MSRDGSSETYDKHENEIVVSDVVAILQDAVLGLLFTSESDYPILVFQLPTSAIDNLQGDDPTSILLSITNISSIVNVDHRQHWTDSLTTINEVSLDWFFARYTKVEDWWEPTQQALLPRWTQLQLLISSYLSDIHVYRIGQASDYGLSGAIDVFIVGRCKCDGLSLVGLHTISVET